MTEDDASGGPEDIEEPSTEEDQASMGFGQILRLLLLVAIIGGAWWAGTHYDLDRYFDQEALRARMSDAGLLGFLAFVVLFTIGELIHIPGLVFLAAAVLAYGHLLGALVGFVGALISASVGFWVARGVGGKALPKIRWKPIHRIIEKIDQRPILATAILRAIFWMAPILNYTLGMTDLRYRHYLSGSAIGLLPPVLAAAFALDWLMARIL